MSETKSFYPDMLVPDEVKNTDEYGMSVARHIEMEWFYGGYDSTRFIRRKRKMAELRSYMTNDVDINKYKNILGVGTGDKTVLALDWVMLQTIPKFVKVVVDGFSEDLYSIEAKAIDKFSESEREKYTTEMRRMMHGRAYSELLSKQSGFDVNPPDIVPDSEDELDLHMEMTYRQGKEIAMEIGTDKIMGVNGWDEIRNMVIEDLAVTRIGATKTTIDSEVGIKISYVDPQSLVYSRGTDKHRDGRDKFYFGEVKLYTIDQVKRMSNSKFTDDEYRAMAAQYSGILGNSTWTGDDDADYSEYRVEVLEFCYKTINHYTAKKKYNKFGGHKYIKKDQDWSPPEGREGTKIQKTYDVWYQGSYVIQSNKIYNYGLMHDTARPSSNIRKAIAPYSVYELSTSSLVEKMLPLAQQIHITHLKIQQIIAKLRPKGIAINIDALEDIDLGAGGVLEPADQIKIFNADGNLIFSGRALEGDMNSPLPIHDIPSDLGRQLPELITVYNHYVQQIRDVTGINPAKDGSSPEKGTLVGTQQMNLAMSNNATRHIFNGYLSVAKDVAENIVLRLQSLAKYGKLGDGIRSLIGESNAAKLEHDKNKFFWIFSIVLKMKPSEEERRAMEENMAIALQNKEIDLDDVIDIRMTDNIKLANQMLKVKRKQKMKRDMQRLKEEEAFRSELKQKEEAALAEANKQEKMTDFEMKMAEKQADNQADAIRGEADRQHDIMMENLRFKHDLVLKREDGSTKTLNDVYKENRKDERQAKAATQQSDMIDQRNKDKPPKDFTAGEGIIE